MGKFTNDLNIKENDLFYYTTVNAVKARCYKTEKIDPRDIFYSETSIRLNLLQLMGYSFFVIYTRSKKNVLLNDKEKKYLSLDVYAEEKLESPLNYEYSESISNLKNNKYLDLNYFHLQSSIKFIFIVLKLDFEGYFYYDLILGINNNNFDLNIINDFKSNLIEVDKIVPLSQVECDVNFIKSFFWVENNIFKDAALSKAEADAWIGYPMLFSSPEFLEREKFYNEYWKLSSFEKSSSSIQQKKKYLNMAVNKKSKELCNYNLYKQIFFKKMCSTIFYYDKYYDQYFNEIKQMWFELPIFRVYTNIYEFDTSIMYYSYDDLLCNHIENICVQYLPFDKSW